MKIAAEARAVRLDLGGLVLPIVASVTVPAGKGGLAPIGSASSAEFAAIGSPRWPDVW
jgi:hypothetical protein